MSYIFLTMSTKTKTKGLKSSIKPPKPIKKHYKRKTVARDDDIAPTEVEVKVSSDKLPDFFEHEDVGGKDKLMHDVEILVMEWAFFYSNHSPTAYILDVKSYSETQRQHIFRILPAEEWPKRRQMAQDKLTGELVKRHIDKLAEVQDQHINASKLGLAQAVRMLAEGKTEVMRGKDGKVVLDKDGNPRFKTFRSIDLLNCMSAIEKAQAIYRKAMGLPNDEGGLQQILNKLERMREVPTFNITTNIQQNTQVNQVAVSAPKNPTDLSYDDIMLLIEAKREQKAKAALTENVLDERLRIEHKEGVPTGDFTAMPQKKGI
jgi:hypothetical protein